MAKHLQNLKKIAVLAIAVLAISLNAKAQEWYVLGEYIWSPPHPQGTFNQIHYQAEDVTINGMEYHTVYVRGEGVLLGAYRNEENQVYYCKWNGTAYDDEALLYDYDLEVGDFFNDTDPHPMRVTDITTIVDKTGVARKKFTFSFLNLEDETEFWIEGIGSSRGFLNMGNYTPTSDGAIFHMLCYHVGDEVVYVNPEYNDCDLPFNVEENTVDNSVGIYPNPASDVVNILNNNDINITAVEILDLMGRTVLSTDKSKNINISELAEGQYFVKIHGETTIVRKLFIKK